MSSSPYRVIISGGGTGGHVFPAIAIARALQDASPKIAIHFVGAHGKLEMEKVPQAGFTIDGLWISGMQRKLTIRNVLFPFKVIWSAMRAWQIIRRFKPNAVIGVGGYASWPVLEIASRAGIPTLIQEQNSYAGMTNKMLAQKVSKICVAYEHMDRFFPAKKISYTGNPVRPNLVLPAHQKIDSYRHFNLDPNKKTIFVFGGSLGARTINQAVNASYSFLETKATEVQIIWQIGKLYWETYAKSETAALSNVFPFQFIDRMDCAYQVADVIACRAGALTISELAITGKPAVLVPSPNVAEDHQTKNALALVEKNAAIYVKDSEASDKMMQAAFDILGNQKWQQELKLNLLALGKPNAAKDIAQHILELIEAK